MCARASVRVCVCTRVRVSVLCVCVKYALLLGRPHQRHVRVCVCAYECMCVIETKKEKLGRRRTSNH